MALENCCYIGRGKIYLAKRPDECPVPGGPVQLPTYYFIGNASTFDLAVNEKEIKEPDYTTAGGGTDCATSYIEDIKVNLDVSCWNIENLRLALFGEGEADNTTAGTMTIQYQLESLCTYVPLEFVHDGVTLTVTDILGGTTYTAGTDYILENNAIFIPDTSTIPSPSVITVTYSYDTQTTLEILKGGAENYYLIFEGINGDNNQNLVVSLFNVKFGPTSGLNFISDEYASLAISGTVQKDPCQNDCYGTMRRL